MVSEHHTKSKTDGERVYAADKVEVRAAAQGLSVRKGRGKKREYQYGRGKRCREFFEQSFHAVIKTYGVLFFNVIKRRKTPERLPWILNSSYIISEARPRSPQEAPAAYLR